VTQPRSPAPLVRWTVMSSGGATKIVMARSSDEAIAMQENPSEFTDVEDVFRAARNLQLSIKGNY